MSEPEGRFNMRFIGKPDGVLMKHAPGNYKHGQVSKQPYKMSKFPYWELIDPKPTFTAPELSDVDDVFEEAVFVPDEAEVEIVLDVSSDEVYLDKYIHNDSPATIEPFSAYRITKTPDGENYANIPVSVTSTESVEGEVTVSTSEPVVEEPMYDRDALKKKLTDAGVEFNVNSRTETLRKLVEDLESQE